MLLQQNEQPDLSEFEMSEADGRKEHYYFR